MCWKMEIIQFNLKFGLRDILIIKYEHQNDSVTMNVRMLIICSPTQLTTIFIIQNGQCDLTYRDQTVSVILHMFEVKNTNKNHM